MVIFSDKRYIQNVDWLESPSRSRIKHHYNRGLQPKSWGQSLFPTCFSTPDCIFQAILERL